MSDATATTTVRAYLIGRTATAGAGLIRTSLREIADQTGITVSQVLGALDALTTSGDMATIGAPHPQRLALVVTATN